MTFELGIIEGYYGRAWSWAQRVRVVQTLAPHGYRFFIYAPKAAASMRRHWREPMAADERASLSAFASACRQAGVRFGLGLSPHGFDDANESEWQSLDRWLEAADELGVSDLALLFDDVRGDDPTLAARQVRLVDHASNRTRARHVYMCPSYYSDDVVLDKVFGQRPADYLQTLGGLLDPAIRVFWTGEEVCSREIGPAHLEEVANRLQRKPTLWDNYPVNDGARMSQYLHLRGFTGRPAANAGLLCAHAINPSLQPMLGCIPAITLAKRYREGDARYAYGQALAEAARLVLGDVFAQTLLADLILLQDTGLDRLGDRAAGLRDRIAAIDHPAAVEILEWLDGGYRITDEIVQTQ